MGWEKIFASHISKKRLMSKIFKKLLQLSSKTPQIIQLKSLLNRLKRHFSKENIHEKVLNITNHQGNTNQNHDEKSPHTCYNGYHRKDNKCW